MRTENFHRTFRVNSAAAATLPIYSRVSVASDGTVDLSAGNSGAVGTIDRPGLPGEAVSVYTWAPTRQAISAGVINVGDLCGPEAATGRFASVGAGGKWVALEAATAADQTVELAVVDD